MTAIDPSWGTTTTLEVSPPGPDDDQWQLSSWREIVFPNEAGQLRHGSTGSILPDTVIVRHAGVPVALADPYAHTLDNQYCYDCEYYLILRLREVLDPIAWRALPWSAFGPGDVFCAWDKFHGHEYSRVPDAGGSMSYGGDWDDLQSYIDERHPNPHGARPPAAVSDATLLRAVRDGNVDQVRALLAAGASPDAGASAPHEALRSVSVDRDATALWEAISQGSSAMVEALLAAGAAVTAARPGTMTPLHGALANRKREVIPALLRHGSDPDATWQGRTAREVAIELGPEYAALFD
jgi:hypothetical protein